MLAMKEVILTVLLQLLSERGTLAHLAFKDEPALENVPGTQGRFSTDLDFTGSKNTIAKMSFWNVLINELGDMYSAENQLVKAFPKL